MLVLSSEIWQARAISTDGLRPCCYAINGVVYAIQVSYCLECLLFGAIIMYYILNLGIILLNQYLRSTQFAQN